MDESKYGTRDKRGDWRPFERIEYPPVFVWPVRAGKLAKWLKAQGHSPVLVAADLQRPNAVTQLQIVGERAGVPVFAPHPGTTSDLDVPTGDPVAVARAGVDEARQKLHDVVSRCPIHKLMTTTKVQIETAPL